MKLEKFQEQVFFSTVRITVRSKSGPGASIGTGFIFEAPLDDDGNKSVLLLISCRHVYGDATQPIIIHFHKRKTDEPSPDLGQVVTLQDTEFTSVYKGHPDPDVDLACINISLISGYNIYYRCLSPKMLSDFSEDDLLPGKDVWFVGYPENRFDIAHNLPILRRGYIASIPKIDFNSNRQFIIDAQVFKGSSGSPVFTSLGGRFKLLGVVAETMIRNEQLQAIPTGFSLGVQQILGLGFVIKAPLVKELVDYVVEEVKLSLENEEDEPVK